MLTIGDHLLQPVLDSVIRADPTKLYPGTTQRGWSAHPEVLTEDGLLQFSIGAYLVRSGGRTILIDLGVGPRGWLAPSGASIPPGLLPEGLASIGVAPEDVTDVLYSHLHPDHVGWSSVDDTPYFPRATYRCHHRDWEYFMGGTGSDVSVRDSLEPIVPHLETWDANITIFPGIDLVEAPGHTPGSTVIVLSGASGARAVLLGDVVHCPVELVDDQWSTIGDVDPELAERTRARFARELEGGESHISAAHFPELRFGRLIMGPDRRRRWGYEGRQTGS